MSEFQQLQVITREDCLVGWSVCYVIVVTGLWLDGSCPARPARGRNRDCCLGNDLGIFSYRAKGVNVCVYIKKDKNTLLVQPEESWHFNGLAFVGH